MDDRIAEFTSADPAGRRAPPSRVVLVVGRRGQVAMALSRTPWPDGWGVRCIGREGIDVTDRRSVERVVARLRPAVVVNAAGYTGVDAAERDPDGARAVNHLGAAIVAATADRAGVPLLHLSSDYVFDGRIDRPYRPADAMRPLSVYGATKAAGEEAVRAACRRHAIVRTAWLHAAEGRNFVTAILGLAAGRSRIAVVHDQVGSPTAADDLAAALARLVRRLADGAEEATGTHHVCGEGHVSRHGLAAAILEDAAALDLSTARAVPVATGADPAAAPRPRWSALDGSGCRAATGMRMRGWREAVRATVARVAAADPSRVARSPSLAPARPSASHPSAMERIAP